MPEGDISLWRRVRRRFYWLLTVVMIRLADLVPITLGRRFCVVLSRLALKVRAGDRRVAEANLARAFPVLDEQGRGRLLEESAEAMGLNLFDTLAAGRLLALKESVVEESGQTPGGTGVCKVLEGLAAQGRGVLILTGHLGCWELLGGWLARELRKRGLDGLGVVTGSVRNPPVDRLLQNRRRRLGMTVLPRRDGAAPLIRYLRSGGIVAVLQDQYTRVQNLDIPFFGEPAPTPAGLARLALRYRIPVLPVAIARDRARNCHVVVHQPPLLVKESLRADEEVEEFMTICNARLENFIRRNPTEWVWFHNRWKS